MVSIGKAMNQMIKMKSISEITTYADDLQAVIIDLENVL